MTSLTPMTPIDCEIQVYERFNDLTVVGKFSQPIESKVKYFAASPPDFRSSFNGSGLPFATERQAFEFTPNVGVVDTDENNLFQISIMKPNSYYVVDQRVLPSITIEYQYGGEWKSLVVNLGDAIPNRTLQSDAFEFPTVHDAVETQEKLLKRRKYC